MILKNKRAQIQRESLAKQPAVLDSLLKSGNSNASKATQTIQQFIATNSKGLGIDTKTRPLIVDAAESLSQLPQVFE